MAEVGEMISSPSLSILFAIGRVAARTLAHMRPVVDLAGSVRTAALSHRTFMVQPGPCAVTIVTSRTPLPVEISHRGSSCVEILSTTGEFGLAGKSFSELGKASADVSPR